MDAHTQKLDTGKEVLVVDDGSGPIQLPVIQEMTTEEYEAAIARVQRLCAEDDTPLNPEDLPLWLQ